MVDFSSVMPLYPQGDDTTEHDYSHLSAAGDPDMLTVEADQYTDLLDKEITLEDERIQIDRRGYSPAVAQHLGPGYLDQQILVLDHRQFEQDTAYREFSALDPVLEELGTRDAGVTLPPTVYDLDLTVGVKDGERVYHLEATINHEQSDEAVGDILDTQTEIEGLTADSIRHLEMDELDETASWYDLPVSVTATTDQVAYSSPDGIGFYFIQDESPVRVRKGTVPMEEWWQQTDDSVIQRLSDGEYIRPDDEAIEHEQKAVAAELVHEMDVDLSNVEHLQEQDDEKHALVDAFLDEQVRTARERYKMLEKLKEDEKILDERSRRSGDSELFDTVHPVLNELIEPEGPNGNAVYEQWYGREQSLQEIDELYEQWNDRSKRYSGAKVAVDGTNLPEGALETYCETTDLGGSDGYFLSAMMNELEQNHFDLPGLPDVDYVGYRNEGNTITVGGDVGDNLAAQMEEGTIIVTGDAGDRTASRMRGGELDIQGDVGDKPARRLHGGRVHIHGDVDDSRGEHWVGPHMRGGTVIVEGQGVPSPFHKSGEIKTATSLREKISETFSR